MTHLLQTLLPGPLIGWMRANPALYRLRHDGIAVMTTGPGAGLRFVPGPSNPAYATGGNELPVQEAVARHLKPGSVFYDIGANVGFFTAIAARLVGGGGLVYAFEPVPENARWIRLNAGLNRLGNVRIVRKAVSESSGSAQLWLAAYSGGSALASAAKPPDAGKTLAVETVCIDDVVFSEWRAVPSVVKIDVEGAELNVLRGMSRTLREVRPVVVYEIDDEHHAAFDQKRRACEDFLAGFGYRVEALPPSYPDIQWLVGHFIATHA